MAIFPSDPHAKPQIQELLNKALSEEGRGFAENFELWKANHSSAGSRKRRATDQKLWRENLNASKKSLS